ncbi:MAG: hypothetical protein FRX48_09653 [Lasallia pustulata]|uniref:BZIP domain-containing protein n=1 Tax=Lasallia pustulata TaxID=136370 RepID=A0A5M8PCD5_9LECA|nr:MAG: hypothetical protein FRX48_09653 [Lasallia pustulata]
MSAVKQESSSTSSPPPQSTCFEAFDIERYINFEQATYSSPSVSPTSSASLSLSTTDPLTVDPNQTIYYSSSSSSQQVFPAPSHQYGQYQQFAVLPVGGVANTIAVNQASSLPFGRNFGASSIDGYFSGSSTDFDFATPASHHSSFSASSDMDMDMDFSARGFLTSTDPQSPNTVVDPNAVGGNEDTTSTPTPTQSSVGRLWPGMHQQQAKAQAQAEAQAQQQKQQQMMTQQPPNLPTQQSLPSAPRNSKASSHPTPDPIVEERISRLLNQMRQSSVASSHDDDAATLNGNGLLPHIARMRKDEEDMDEDERLLASEEGKKLSSKERRQLRNKVSARAFRSRRKEYIGQLEGEVAAKAKEADDLRAKNEALIAENTRLTDLTRMLMASDAFSTFLAEMSNEKRSTQPNSVSTPAPSAPSSTPRTQTTDPRPNVRKDINPRHASQQQMHRQQPSGPHVGMAMVPETLMDYSTFESPGNAWTGNIDLGFTNAQVFTVVDLPSGPAVDQIDSGFLSGKSSNLFGSYSSSDDIKDQAPVIERMPSIPSLQEAKVVMPQEPVHPVDDVDIDESDPCFALFADCATVSKPSTPEAHGQLFGNIESEKVFARLDLVVEEASDDGHISAAAMGRFERICSSIDSVFQRIGAVTSHL